MLSDDDSWTKRFHLAMRTTMENLGHRMFVEGQFELTPPQYFMLYCIQNERQCTVSQLADKMHVKPSAITVMLDRLEQHGCIVRIRDQADRRVVYVQLTETGSEYLEQVMQIRKQMIQQCLKQLPQQEFDAFLNTLEKIAAFSDKLDMKTIIDSVLSSKHREKD
ncbi:MAG: MarR family transcriptional regulator [Bacilli bacterium]|nr:MarR family transcriptional regulator [Bacilli bacterium]